MWWTWGPEDTQSSETLNWSFSDISITTAPAKVFITYVWITLMVYLFCLVVSSLSPLHLHCFLHITIWVLLLPVITTSRPPFLYPILSLPVQLFFSGTLCSMPGCSALCPFQALFLTSLDTRFSFAPLGHVLTFLELCTELLQGNYSWWLLRIVLR